MKKLLVFTISLVLASISLIALTGCNGTIGSPVTGNGNMETRSFDYDGFNKLEIDKTFDVEVTKSDSFAISVTADSNLYEYMDVRKDGSTLHIGLQRNHTYFSTTLKAVITMPDLRGLNVFGASKCQISGFNSTNSLVIEVSGASRLEISDVKAGDTDIEVSGASRATGKLEMVDGNFNISGASIIELGGTAESVVADISGASSGRLEDFTLTKAKMTVSGASNSTISVSSKLDANVSGASRLYYIGSPTLGDIDVTGASTFSKK